MPVKLLAIPASHPCAAVEAMLKAKGVPYVRSDLFPGLSRGWLRLLGFAGGTVPALIAAGTRVQGSRSIARWLDASWPDPPLFPVERAARERVEEIEAWADGPLQASVRRIILWVLLRDRQAVAGALAGARLQFRIPVRIAQHLAWPVLRLDAALNDVTAEAVRDDVRSLSASLERVDGWIASGILGGVPPSAADYQVAGSLRLLATIDDLAPLMGERPAAVLARTLIPTFPGRVGAGVLPRAWLR